MDRELMNRYQQTISLLQFKNPGYSFSGSFMQVDDRVAFELYIIESDPSTWECKTHKKVFKPMKNEEMAIKYFIKSAQNLCLKNMFNN